MEGLDSWHERLDPNQLLSQHQTLGMLRHLDQSFFGKNACCVGASVLHCFLSEITDWDIALVKLPTPILPGLIFYFLAYVFNRTQILKAFKIINQVELVVNEVW